MEAAPDPLIGVLVGDRYRILAPLGRGGMGVVYRVEHTMMKKELALKLLHPELGRIEEVAKRFEREAEAAARLDHPHIIGVTDFGRTAEGQLFLAMELLHGPSLAEVIRACGARGGALGAERAVRILVQVLRALEHAHRSGVVHRDLKPENIVLIERDGDPDFVKLLDFGIAKITHGQSASSEALTQAGVIFGTPEYLSPEQAMGEEADGRADLYAAGVMLYEMLTGRRPFESQSKVEVLSKHLTQPPPPMSQTAPGAQVSPELERVAQIALAKKRTERFPTAGAFALALGASGRAATGPTAALGGAALLARAANWLRYTRSARRPGDGRGGVPALAGAAKMRIGRVWAFLVQRAREAGVPWPRAFIGGALGLVACALALLAFARQSFSPALPSEVAADLKRVESLLAHGELVPARVALQQLLHAHPESAAVHYLFGNLDYAEGDRSRALRDYHDALKLDERYGTDPILRSNVRTLLERRFESLEAVQLLAEDVGKPALADLVTCAKSCKEERARHHAAEAAVRLGGPQLIAEETRREAPGGSSPDELEERLRAGRSCKERKVAAAEMIATGERRYLAALKEARARSGGFLGLSQVNRCMRRELDAAIQSWEGK